MEVKNMYETRNILQRFSDSNQEPDETTDEYLISNTPITSYEVGQTKFGYSRISVYLINQQGTWKFLFSDCWIPATGYSAHGTDEEIYSIQKTIEILSQQEGIGEFLKALLGQTPVISE